MAIRLDDNVPVVWRDPDSIQFGAVRPLAVVSGVGRTQLALIEALRRGVARSALDLIAFETGGDDRDVDVLLASIEPALLTGNSATPGASQGDPADAALCVGVDGDGPIATAVAGALAELDCQVESVGDGQRPDIVVIVAHYVITPARHARWLRRDIPHLQVLTHDGGATIGPLVEPGSGPCLRCLDLEHRDQDPAWPAIATQLLSRSAPVSAAELRALTATVATVVDGRLRRNQRTLSHTAIEMTRGDESRVRELTVHPECGCQSPEEIVTALVGRVPASPARPSSAPTAAVPA